MELVVLLIDDEDQITLIEEAEQDGLTIEQYMNHADGEKAFARNPHKYFAVVLDVKGLKNNQVDATNAVGFYQSLRFFSENRSEHPVPVLVFTGQPSYQDETSFRESTEGYNVKVFKKATDSYKLLEALQQAQQQHKLFNTISRHQVVFQALTRLKIPKTNELDFALLWDLAERRSSAFDPKGNLTTLRRFTETLFHQAINLGFVHPEFSREGKVTFANTYLCLKGEYVVDFAQKTVFWTEGPVIPKAIVGGLDHTIAILTASAHEDNTNQNPHTLELNDYITNQNFPLLLNACLNYIAQLAMWLQDQVDLNPEIKTQRLLKKLDLPCQAGPVVEQGGWRSAGIFHLDTRNKDAPLGGTITIRSAKPNNNHRTKAKCPLYSNDFYHVT